MVWSPSYDPYFVDREVTQEERNSFRLIDLCEERRDEVLVELAVLNVIRDKEMALGKHRIMWSKVRRDVRNIVRRYNVILQEVPTYDYEILSCQEEAFFSIAMRQCSNYVSWARLCQREALQVMQNVVTVGRQMVPDKPKGRGSERSEANRITDGFYTELWMWNRVLEIVLIVEDPPIIPTKYDPAIKENIATIDAEINEDWAKLDRGEWD